MLTRLARHWSCSRPRLWTCPGAGHRAPASRMACGGGGQSHRGRGPLTATAALFTSRGLLPSYVSYILCIFTGTCVSVNLLKFFLSSKLIQSDKMTALPEMIREPVIYERASAGQPCPTRPAVPTVTCHLQGHPHQPKRCSEGPSRAATAGTMLLRLSPTTAPRPAPPFPRPPPCLAEGSGCEGAPTPAATTCPFTLLRGAPRSGTWSPGHAVPRFTRPRASLPGFPPRYAVSYKTAYFRQLYHTSASMKQPMNILKRITSVATSADLRLAPPGVRRGGQQRAPPCGLRARPPRPLGTGVRPRVRPDPLLLLLLPAGSGAIQCHAFVRGWSAGEAF